MICPFRKIVKTVKVEEVYVITEEFAECYEGDCPFYEAETLSYYESCRRCEIDTGE